MTYVSYTKDDMYITFKNESVAHEWLERQYDDWFAENYVQVETPIEPNCVVTMEMMNGLEAYGQADVDSALAEWIYICEDDE